MTQHFAECVLYLAAVQNTVHTSEEMLACHYEAALVDALTVRTFKLGTL
jgi:hypothetical protein